MIFCLNQFFIIKEKKDHILIITMIFPIVLGERTIIYHYKSRHEVYLESHYSFRFTNEDSSL